MQNLFTKSYREHMVRVVFLFILASFVFRYYNHVLLHQLLQPVIFKTDSDLAYWLYLIAGFGKLIVQNHAGSLIFDSVLISLCLTSIVYASQRVTVIAFSILYPLYFLSYNAYVTHHTGTMNGILLITFAFWTMNTSTFRILWEALRYFTLSIYSMAFLWKFIIGASVFNTSGPEAIVKDNLALYLYLNPDTLFATAMYWFIQHPLLLYLGYGFCVLIQASMIIGFFTRKYDRLLCMLAILFHFVTYFFVDVFYFELLILNFTFIRVDVFSRFTGRVKKSSPLFQKAYLPT
ncbi:MAG: hypothetical protein WKI04_16300 [Ferruginibacter sp.]